MEIVFASLPSSGNTTKVYITYKYMMIITFSLATILIGFGIWTLWLGFKAKIKLVTQITMFLMICVISFSINSLTYYYILKVCNTSNLFDCDSITFTVQFLVSLNIISVFVAFFCFDIAYIMFVYRYLMTGISMQKLAKLE